MGKPTMNTTPRANTFTERQGRIVQFGNGPTGERDYVPATGDGPREATR
jgi:hypothetical protein